MILPVDGITKLKSKRPLIHQITNYVTVNDCANATLAIGGSPIMADELEEVADITAVSQALVINIGTLNNRTISSMIRAGEVANHLGIPIVLDPVGVGASELRKKTCERLLNSVNVSVIKGNASEIRYLAGEFSNGIGVDVSETDEENLNDLKLISQQLAQKLGCIIVCTGKNDIITNGERLVVITNGVSMMKHITGTGCMSSALIASFLGAFPNEAFQDSVLGMLTIGISGELAYEVSKQVGTSSFRMNLIDNISTMTDDKLITWGKLDEMS